MSKQPKQAMECQKPGCERPARKKGVCLEHYAENYVAGCTVDGCTEELFAKGRCKAHYMRKYRKTKGESAPPADAPVRAYGQERFDVFTRIPKEAADVILRVAGRRDGMYEKAQEILTDWAERHAG